MSLESLNQVGSGGTGIPTSIPKAIKELQGLTFSTLTGAASGTKINLNAIRPEDTVLAAWEYAAGANPVDRAGVLTIEDLKASGTVTFAAAAALDTITVRGIVYTATAAAAANDILNRFFSIAGTDTADAVAFCALVNQVDPAVVCTNIAGVVTIKAFVEGTAGNAYTLVSSNGTRLAVSGATLAGGSATGGIKIADDTTGNQVIVAWFNKK